MHELSIASYLLEAVLPQAREAGAQRVLAINLIVGDRAGIVNDSLQFSFELLAAETPAEGAHLHITRTPMRFHCGACANDYLPDRDDFRCQHCGRVGAAIDGGSELLIESIEIET